MVTVTAKTTMPTTMMAAMAPTTMGKWNTTTVTTTTTSSSTTSTSTLSVDATTIAASLHRMR